MYSVVQILLFSSALLALAAPPAHSAVLPALLTDAHVARNTARWNIPDIVEIRRIMGTAVQGTSRVGAFILEEPSIADGKNHYGLYELDAASGGPPRKIAEADYMADLAWRPGTDDWTVRADFGAGVQLFTVRRSGVYQPLLVVPDTAVVGGNVGVMGSSLEGARLTGVLSYGWSPDGRRFWYSRLRHRDQVAQREFFDNGVVVGEYVNHGLSVPTVNAATTISDYELRVFDTTDMSDTLVSSTINLNGIFNASSVAWADPSHLQYHWSNVNAGTVVWTMRRFDVSSRNDAQVAMEDGIAAFNSTPTKAGYLMIKHEGNKNTLVEVALDGRLIKRYGAVSASSLIGGAIWRRSAGDGFIYGTHQSDRDGLSAFPEGALSKALAVVTDHLSACSFNADLSFGLCSDESLTNAPELVSISGATGALAVVSQPNARYDAITPLKTVRKEWTNRYGAKSTGYVTYPRGYVSGRSYPALVVTHAWDAKNKFASDWIQWEFPTQVMAEQGYFILYLNEPKWDPSIPVPYTPGGVAAGVEKQEFNQYLNPLASLEAAIQPFISSGDINPNAIGIAGYSHGAELAYFAISHSRLFSAVSLGDDSGITPAWFWVGVSTTTTWMKALYGGSPFDAAALENYRKYSTSFRVEDVKTPLLQQYAGTFSAESGLLSDQLFKDAGIPAELVDYPDESHVFYAPRHRASAMARNIDWFNYWLLGRRDPDPAKVEQYTRWDAMAARWHAVKHVGGSDNLVPGGK